MVILFDFKSNVRAKHQEMCSHPAINELWHIKIESPENEATQPNDVSVSHCLTLTYVDGKRGSCMMIGTCASRETCSMNQVSSMAFLCMCIRVYVFIYVRPCSCVHQFFLLLFLFSNTTHYSLACTVTVNVYMISCNVCVCLCALNLVRSEWVWMHVDTVKYIIVLLQ